MRVPAHALSALVAALNLLNLQTALTSAHSWLECTDYRIDQNSEAGKIWDPSKCMGRARCTGSLSEPGYTFGQDKGFDEHSSSCQCARGSADDNAPKATYTPGQRVCLAYPPKNHVAAPCTNEYIPDAGVRITRSKVGATTDDDDKAATKSYVQGNGEHVSGSFDYKGFQHCPNFCENPDKALCTMCFDLESDLAPGEYSFKWIWDFHGQGDIYTSCWEATVGGEGQQPQAQASGNSSAAGNSQGQATVAMGNPVSYEASPASTPEATQAPTSSPSSSPSSTPTVTSSSPSPTPAVYAAVAGEADADCEDELDVASEDDCDDKLDMAGTNDEDADCEEELDMAAGTGEVGADADPGYGGDNGQSADHTSPSAPAKTENAQNTATGGNYGSGAGNELNAQSPPATTTGGDYSHGNAQNPATGSSYGGGDQGNAQSPPASGDAQTPPSGNSLPASNNVYGANNQGSTHHVHEYGHSNGGHYPRSYSNNHATHDNSKHHEGQPPAATTTGGQSESTPADEVDPGCEQGLTLAKDKPTETSGGGYNTGKVVDTPVAYPSDSQSPEAAAAAPGSTPGTGAEAQSSETAMPAQAAATPETGADADHGQGYGHQGPSQPASDGAAEPATPTAADVSGEAPATEDPDCDEKLPYAYGNETSAVQGEADDDCDKGIPIASEAPGKGEQGGGHHGPHHRNHYHQGESYSFTSEQKPLEGEATNNTQNLDANPVGVVAPYPGE